MVEIIPKPERKIPGWQKALLYFSVLFLILTVFGYLVVASFERNSERELENLTRQIAEGKSEEIVLLEEQVLSYKKEIDKVAPFFKQHTLSSQIFDFVEKNTHPKTFFFEFSLKSDVSTALLSGLTDSFLSLGQQIVMLDEAPQVESVEMADVFLVPTGGIEFQLEVILKDSLFKYLCGNGELDEGEQCDDGNNLNDDGCSAQCLLEED